MNWAAGAGRGEAGHPERRTRGGRPSSRRRSTPGSSAGSCVAEAGRRPRRRAGRARSAGRGRVRAEGDSGAGRGGRDAGPRSGSAANPARTRSLEEARETIRAKLALRPKSGSSTRTRTRLCSRFTVADSRSVTSSKNWVSCRSPTAPGRPPARAGAARPADRAMLLSRRAPSGRSRRPTAPRSSACGAIVRQFLHQIPTTPQERGRGARILRAEPRARQEPPRCG
jgi:hypothetical protein